MYYVTTCTYVGPNTFDSIGARLSRDPVAYIQTEPGTKNQSGAECIDGWLGTTNDWDRHAYGEFETLSQAQARCKELGCTVSVSVQEEDGEVIEERWQTPDSCADHLEAANWFQPVTPHDLGISAATTDAELATLIAREREAARTDTSNNPQGVILHDLEEYLTDLRDQLREA